MINTKGSFMRSFILLCILIGFSKLPAQSWQPTNGPLGGEADAITIDSTGNIFIGSHSGIFRSIDNGDTWEKASDGVNSSFINGLLSKASYIFCATNNIGLYRSSDNGDNWQRMNDNLSATNIQSMTMRSTGELLIGSDGDGVLYSADNGETWTELNDGLADLRIFATAVTPNGDIYAGTIATGIYRFSAADSGWTAISTGLENLRCTSLAVDSSGNVFAGTARGVHKLAAGDTIWAEVTNGVNTLGFISSIYLTDNEELFAATLSGIFKFDSTTQNWTDLNNGVTYPRTNKVTSNPAGHLFLTTDGGVFRSQDNGASWTHQVDGFITSTILEMVHLPDGTVIAGSENSGIYRAVDDGVNWQSVNNGLSSQSIRSLHVDKDGVLFTGTSGNGGIFRSIDNGDSWTSISDGLGAGTVYDFAATESHIYAAVSNVRVFGSENDGDEWQLMTTSGITNTSTRALAVKPGGTLFLGTWGGGVFRLSAADTSWTEVNNGLSDQDGLQVNDLLITPAGKIIAGTWGGIFQSTDNGVSWTKMDEGLDSPRVYSLARAASGDLFVSTLSGVALSRDFGNSWIELNEGLENTVINSMTIKPDGQMFAGSDGNGVYHNEIVLTSVQNPEGMLPQKFVLNQNYPNPFNPQTSIRYELPRKSHVRLAIYNALGQQVSILVDEVMPAGSHTIRWNGTDDHGHPVASGLYIYRLENENFISSKKLVLMR